MRRGFESYCKAAEERCKWQVKLFSNSNYLHATKFQFSVLRSVALREKIRCVRYLKQNKTAPKRDVRGEGPDAKRAALADVVKHGGVSSSFPPAKLPHRTNECKRCLFYVSRVLNIFPVSHSAHVY